MWPRLYDRHLSLPFHCTKAMTIFHFGGMNISSVLYFHNEFPNGVVPSRSKDQD